jgi:hypothetical protein
MNHRSRVPPRSLPCGRQLRKWLLIAGHSLLNAPVKKEEPIFPLVYYRIRRLVIKENWGKECELKCATDREGVKFTALVLYRCATGTGRQG